MTFSGEDSKSYLIDMMHGLQSLPNRWALSSESKKHEQVYAKFSFICLLISMCDWIDKGDVRQTFGWAPIYWFMMTWLIIFGIHMVKTCLLSKYRIKATVVVFVGVTGLWKNWHQCPMFYIFKSCSFSGCSSRFLLIFLEGYSIGFNVFICQHALLFCLYSSKEVYNERDWWISSDQTFGIQRVLRIEL